MKEVSVKQSGLSFEPHRFHLLWHHTMLRVESLTRRVNEGKDIEAAADFARWLRVSGLVRLFEANPQREPLLVDGATMDAQLTDLILACGEQWKSNAPRMVNASEIEKLNHKIDVMAQALGSLFPRSAVVEITSEPVAQNPLLLVEDKS